jgi:putative flippase GtrA
MGVGSWRLGFGIWLRFNLVGAMGFAVQTAVLSALVRWAGLPTSVAVAIAVLAAVSHNFLWHEHFTWPNRPPELRWRRWASFHASTGLMSVVSNIGVTVVVMAVTGLPAVASNVVAVALVSVATFWINDRLVFRQ